MAPLEAAAVGHTDKVYAVAWSPVDPHVLVSGGDDGTIRLWDVRRGGGGACLLTFNQHSTTGGVRSFGTCIATNTALGLAVADLKRGRRAVHFVAAEARASTTASAHNNGVNGLCFAPDGFHVLSTGRDQRMRLWDAGRGTNMLVRSPP